MRVEATNNTNLERDDEDLRIHVNKGKPEIRPEQSNGKATTAEK